MSTPERRGYKEFLESLGPEDLSRLLSEINYGHRSVKDVVRWVQSMRSEEHEAHVITYIAKCFGVEIPTSAQLTLELARDTAGATVESVAAAARSADAAERSADAADTANATSVKALSVADKTRFWNKVSAIAAGAAVLLSIASLVISIIALCKQ